MPDGPLSDKLHVYFRDLAPEARLMLATALDKAGDALPHAGMIIGALKEAMRANNEVAAIGDLSDFVFVPCKPFLIANTKVTKVPGAIQANSLTSVWKWLERDAAAGAITRLRTSIETDLFGRLPPQVLATTRTACVRAMQEALKALSDDRQGLSRLSGLVGSDGAAADLQDICAALRHSEMLETFSTEVGNDLKLSGEEVMPALRQRLGAIGKKGKSAFPLALHILKVRIGNPAAAVRFLVALAGTSNGETLAKSPYAPLLELVLQDVEQAVARAQTAGGASQTADVVAAIRDFGVAMRAIEAEIKLDSRSTHSKRVNAFRKGMSGALSSRLSDVTHRVKQLVRLKADPKRETVMPDADEIDRLDGDVAVLMAARNYAEDMALKADTLRVYSEIKDLFDTGAPLLIDRLRSLPIGERGPIRERLDAVARISKRLLGEEYAGLLIKAVHVADAPPAERKAG